MTQNNRATLLSEIASLPGEDRRARLLAALAAYDEALLFRGPIPPRSPMPSRKTTAPPS